MRRWAQDSVPIAAQVRAPATVHPLHRLQSAAGNRAVQRLVAKLPRKPPPEHEAEERVTLLALSGQVARLREGNPSPGTLAVVLEYQEKISALLEAPDRKAVNKLIREVERTFPNRPKEKGVRAQSPSRRERAALKSEFPQAQQMIASARNDTIDALFRKDAARPKGEVRAEVKAGLSKISGYLQVLEQQASKRVKVDRNGGGTHLSGTGATAMLVLASNFRDRDDVARTLIHEASHGCELLTLDYAYSGTSYFLRLPSLIALKNADSYAFACDPAALAALPRPETGKRKLAEATLAVERASFMASANWKHVSWMLRVYHTRRDSNAVTREDAIEHGERLGLGDKRFIPLRVEHLAVLRDFFLLAGRHLNSGYRLKLRKGALNIVTGEMPPITVPGFSKLRGVGKASDAVLRAVAASRGLPDALQVVKESSDLFERYYLSDHSVEATTMWNMFTEGEPEG